MVSIDTYYYISLIDTEIISLLWIPSIRLTSAFSGRRYVADFLSGKIDVLHIVFPIVTSTGSDPHPRADFPNFCLISPESASGTLTKCHAPCVPG